MLRVLPDILDHVRFTGQRLLVVAAMREFLPALASVGRYDAVAIANGAGLPISIRPTAVAAAVAEARAALGSHRYDALVDTGRTMSYVDVEHFMSKLVLDET
jgi:hypothetical protein